MANRCLILVDGSNFYFKLKSLKLTKLLGFDFKAFAKFLTKNDNLISATYYIGRIRQDRTKKSDTLLSNQQKLLVNLKNMGFKYKLGYILKSASIYHEKGVDVQIAIDIMEAAYEKKCDKIILVSSDTDLAPAIKKAQSKGVIVEYVGFSNMPSNAMMRFCKHTQLLSKSDLVKFTP